MTAACQVVRYTVGDYASAQRLMRYRSRLPYAAGLRMVQFCHGYPAGPQQFTPAGDTAPGTLIEALIASGRYVPFAADQGGTNLWGSSAVPTDIEAANAYIANAYAARTSKFALIGYSMGFLNATAELIANPSKVPVMIGIAPATNGAHLYSDVGGQMATDMDAAAGGSWASVDATRSPASRASVFTGNNIHVECWQGTSDATVRPADTSAFCTAVGGTYHAVAGDHGTVWANVDPADVLAALDAGDWS